MFRRIPFLFYRYASRFNFWLKRRFTPAGRFVLLGIALSACFGLDTNQTTAYQTFTFLVAVGSISLLWRLLRLPHPFQRREGVFAARRILPRFVTAGQPASYHIALRNLSRQRRSGLALLEDSPDPRPTAREFCGRAAPRPAGASRFEEWSGRGRWQEMVARRLPAVIPESRAPDLPPGGEADLKIEFTPRRRGILRFDGLTVAQADVFGLYRSFTRLPLEQSLLILPRRYHLPPMEMPGRQEYQPGGVALASSVGESEEFVSLRDYRPGDPLRRIHWRSAARTGRLIVKEYEDEFFVRHALVLDTFAAPEQAEAFEEAVSVAASFVCALQTQDSLLDLLFVGPEAYCFTAGRSLARPDRMLEILAAVDVCRNHAFDVLNGLVLRHAAAVSGCVCVFLAWDEPRRRLVELIQSLRVPVRVVVVTDDRRKEPLDPGPMRDQPRLFHHVHAGRAAEEVAGW